MQELNIDEKNAIELSMLAIENRILKQRIASKDEIIDDLMDDVRFYSERYQEATKRADMNMNFIKRLKEELING